MKAIEENITKPAFTSKVRFIYLAERSKFKASSFAGILGGFRQFSDITLNFFEPDKHTVTGIKKLFFQDSTRQFRKYMILSNYKKRKINSGKYDLNVEELATVYHFPGEAVTANTLNRVQSKKATPPSNLPIIES